MKTYAVLKNNLVDNIVIADDENFFAIAYPDDVVIEVTSETGPANIGVEFINNKFVPMKTWDSWIFDTDLWMWKAPVSYPQDGGDYLWNEDLGSWSEVQAPV